MELICVSFYIFSVKILFLCFAYTGNSPSVLSPFGQFMSVGLLVCCLFRSCRCIARIKCWMIDKVSSSVHFSEPVPYIQHQNLRPHLKRDEKLLKCWIISCVRQTWNQSNASQVSSIEQSSRYVNKYSNNWVSYHKKTYINWFQFVVELLEVISMITFPNIARPWCK